MKNTKVSTKLKFKLWDEFGKPIDKFRGSPKDISCRMKKVLKKYS
jgi:hypothetical protein